jgi:hypothetical protein
MDLGVELFAPIKVPSQCEEAVERPPNGALSLL